MIVGTGAADWPPRPSSPKASTPVEYKMPLVDNRSAKFRPEPAVTMEGWAKLSSGSFKGGAGASFIVCVENISSEVIKIVDHKRGTKCMTFAPSIGKFSSERVARTSDVV